MLSGNITYGYFVFKPFVVLVTRKCEIFLSIYNHIECSDSPTEHVVSEGKAHFPAKFQWRTANSCDIAGSSRSRSLCVDVKTCGNKIWKQYSVLQDILLMRTRRGGGGQQFRVIGFSEFWSVGVFVCFCFCLFGLLSNTEYVNISKQSQGEEKRKNMSKGFDESSFTHLLSSLQSSCITVSRNQTSVEARLSSKICDFPFLVTCS